MNPCVFHTTDPRDLNSNRVAINFRVIIKQTNYLKICLNSSHYTNSLLIRLKNIKIYTQLLTKKGYIIVNENNQNLTSKLIN